MNCAECRDNLVACAEGLLDRAAELECRAHLEHCVKCSSEYAAMTRLQERLVARGQTAREAALVEPVMRRVLLQAKPKESIMNKLFAHRWGFGLGAAATAAAIVIGVVIGLSPKAFGIEQVIEAYNKIRFLHIKEFRAKAEQPNEFWIKSDAQGQVEEARYYLPATEDGPKLITWTPKRTEIWFKRKKGFLIFQTHRIAPWMQSLLEQSQPQWVLKKLQEAEQSGKVSVTLQNAPGRDEPGVIVVTYLHRPRKDRYEVDPKTDLIRRVQCYRVEGTNDVLESTTLFSDYNVPIPEKMFSLRGELPKDVRIADMLNQVAGVAQGNLTDDQAAAETVRQFFQALIDKDYKKAGLIYGGLLEEYAREEFGRFNVSQIISVGPAELQTNWVKRGYRVPCQLALVDPDGKVSRYWSAPYVRPGDDETHPDHWNITGGTGFTKALPGDAKYAKMTAKQAAEDFFKACSEKNWDEVLKFWPLSDTDLRFEKMKDYLGGLQIISIGEPYQSKPYPGWYVPYEIKLSPQTFYVRVSNTNPAGRYVITGILDRKLKLFQDLHWTNTPAILPDNAAYARLTPAEAVKAYYDAVASLDWDQMRKFAPAYDVENDKTRIETAEKQGLDVHALLPKTEVGDAFWSAEQSAMLVKCRSLQVKKWKLALRKDNPAGRWQFDGGI